MAAMGQMEKTPTKTPTPTGFPGRWAIAPELIKPGVFEVPGMFDSPASSAPKAPLANKAPVASGAQVFSSFFCEATVGPPGGGGGLSSQSNGQKTGGHQATPQNRQAPALSAQAVPLRLRSLLFETTKQGGKQRDFGKAGALGRGLVVKSCGRD